MELSGTLIEEVDSMTRTKVARWMATFLLAVGFGQSLAQSPPTIDSPPDVLAQMTRLNQNLARISETLDAVLTNQRIDLMIRRIELAERRLEPLAERVEDERARIESLESEIARLEAAAESLERRRDRAVREGRAVEPRDEEILDQIDDELRQLRKQLETHRRRDLELSQDHERERERIAILDERLQELLDEGR